MGLNRQLPAAYPSDRRLVMLDHSRCIWKRVPGHSADRPLRTGASRLTNLSASTNRFTTAEGYFSQQLLKQSQAERTIGNVYGL